ncbi:hypothetical protein J2Z32_000307 [Paenibacillus turicensis]|uniref:DUF2247 domain-containing protein n=1 Tax=Paenibacillus turicensis TaxID=160487 RepID=A0ABS4FM88_9BACL|nr:DUF2247 family protein [Paenibacillus turicensis]MBP1903695.1 hypothetical protein [Paenibacillus turicensis]
MIPLHLFQKNKVPITWTSLLIGIEGPGKFEKLLETQEVINYAIEYMDLNEDYPNEVLELASAYRNECELVEKLLRDLSSREGVNREDELKKWIIILLIETLSELPENPLYGLIVLTEFWEKFDYPDYSPHTIQGKDNEIKPEEYYTQAYYENCVNKHKEWIDKMIRNM